MAPVQTAGISARTRILSLPEPAAECPTLPESLTERIDLSKLDMEDKEKEDLRFGSLPPQRTKIQEPQNRVNPEDESQRCKPPD